MTNSFSKNPLFSIYWDIASGTATITVCNDMKFTESLLRKERTWYKEESLVEGEGEMWVILDQRAEKGHSHLSGPPKTFLYNTQVGPCSRSRIFENKEVYMNKKKKECLELFTLGYKNPELRKV